MPINENVHYVKFIRGTTTAWQKLLLTPSKINDDTLYFIYESSDTTKGKLYLGQRLISGVGEESSSINISDIGDIHIDDETLSHKQILVYNEETGQWENSSLTNIISEAVNVMTGANAAADGTAGLVPQPKAGDELKFLRGDGNWTVINQPTFDSNIFTKNNLNEITLAGITTAPVGSIPTKTAYGIEWQQPGTINRTIISQEDLDELIENGQPNESTIYMVRNSEDDTSSNLYDEYFIISGKLERLGTFGNVNLNDYVTKESFQTTIQSLEDILNDTTDSTTGELVPGLISRVSTIENNYLTQADIGDLSTLLYSSDNQSQTLVEEVNNINERLTWQELEND